MYLGRKKDQVLFVQRGGVGDSLGPGIEGHPGSAGERKSGCMGMEFAICAIVNHAPRVMRLPGHLVAE